MSNRRAFSVKRLAYSKILSAIRYPLSAKKGLTLVELFIAIALAGLALLPITAVDIVSRKFLNTANYESRVQNEVGPILEMIAKDIARGYGMPDNPGVIVSATNDRVDIRQIDTTPTYDDFTDDSWVRYSYQDAPRYRITRRKCTAASQSDCSSWGDPETLANNISACSFTIASDVSLNKNLWVTIAITARRDAAILSSPTNPEVTLRTTIAARSQSIH